MIENPCSFKGVCKGCIAVDTDNRPLGCQNIKCKHLTPCRRCGMNKQLDADDLCRNCNGTSKVAEDRKKQMESGSTSIGERKITMTVPGTPPPELEQHEKEYYTMRWEEYKGYYRDPAAFYICHAMILEEMNLTTITATILQCRGERKADLEKAKSVAINLLKKLKEQLPEKEAQQETDDEKSLAGIHDAYLKAKAERYRGGVSRIFTEEAIALAPELPFKLNLRSLLESCGYEIISIEDALAKVKTDFKTPLELLRFLGMRIDEKYAMDDAEEIYVEDDEERKPVIDIGLEEEAE